MRSSCPRLGCVPTIIIRPSASSWEFVTTIDYEWSVIRGRRPYRWTIAVRNDNVWFRSSLSYRFSVVDILGYSLGHSLGRDTQHFRFGLYDPIQLSGISFSQSFSYALSP